MPWTWRSSNRRCARCSKRKNKAKALFGRIAESGQAGRATVLRVYEQNGMRCAEIEHVFTTGDANRYVVPFCRIASGEWRIAF